VVDLGGYEVSKVTLKIQQSMARSPELARVQAGRPGSACISIQVEQGHLTG